MNNGLAVLQETVHLRLGIYFIMNSVEQLHSYRSRNEAIW